MAPPISTYQTENFDPPPDEELICSICRCVFYDPVECPCRHVYCRTCICNWLNRHKTCPVCRKRASVTTLQTVVPLIKNMIMKLTINCPNVERGCKQKMPLEAKASHLMNCEYEMIQCRNTNCKEKFVRKDIAKHEQKECKCRKVRCHRKCMLMIPFNMIKTHSCVEELKKELKEKKSVIEDLKKEVEQYKAELKKIKNEFQQTVNRNSVRDFSDDLGSLHSDGSFSSSLSTVDFTDSDSNLSNFPSVISFNSDEHDVEDVEEPEVRSFIDLILMTLFPSSDEIVERQTTQVNTTPGSVDLMINNDATREISTVTLSQEEANGRQSQPNINICEPACNYETVRNSSLGEATTSRSVPLPNNNSNASETFETFQEQECENSDLSSGEITPAERSVNHNDVDDENMLALRSRMLKRKSPIPALSDSSESEPQRVRRRWNGKHIQESHTNLHTNFDKASTSVPCDETSENTKSFETLYVSPSTSSADRSPNSRILRGKFTKQSKIPVSRVPVVVSSQDSNQANCDSQKTDTSQPLQLLHCDVNDETQSRTLIDGSNCEAETGRHPRSFEQAFRRAQRALLFLKSYTAHSRTETRMDSSENNEMSTLELLNRLAEESDPDWEPADDGDETDETISDIVEMDSNYEVKIPDRTWDLLERYSQESSDDDADWLPPVHCKTRSSDV